MKLTCLLPVLLLFTLIVQLDCLAAYADEPRRWQQPKYVYYVTRTTLGGVWYPENNYRSGTRQVTPGINELHYSDGDVRLMDVASPVLGPFYSKAELCAGCAHLPAEVLRQFGCVATTTPPARKKDWRYLILLVGGGIVWYLLAQRSAVATQVAQAGTTQSRPMSDATVGGTSSLRSEPTVSGKFLQGSLTDRQLEQLKHIGVDRQGLNAVRNEINKFGDDPLRFLTQAIKENKVVMLDSVDQTQYTDYVASILPELKKAGATHLAVETLAQAGQDILKSANGAGLKIVAIRPDTAAPGIDERIAKEITKLVNSAGNSKVIFWGASMFTTRGAVGGPSAADLLGKQFRVVSIAAPMEEYKALSKLTPDLRSPVAVSTGAASNLSRFPMTSKDSPGKETLGLWNGLIMVPRPR